MTVYLAKTDGSLASLLAKASHEGEVRIQDEEGHLFILKPEDRRSPLDIRGVDVDISREEIIAIVRESRER